MVLKCIDCGKDFELTSSEIRFYERKNLSIPKRCPKCRKFKGLHKNAARKLRAKTNFEEIL